MSHLARFLSTITLSLLISSAAMAGTKGMATSDDKTAARDTASAPATTTSTDSNYTLRAGDNLHVSVWKEDELDRVVLILPDGTIDFPLIGSVKAAGLTPAQLKQSITDKLKPMIPAASVSVVVRDTLGNTISVIGQVAHPGDFVMSHELSVMQALSQAGGPTPYADEDSIVILRKTDGKETSIPFDYSDVSRGRHLDSNVNLLPGDVVVVPTASLF